MHLCAIEIHKFGDYPCPKPPCLNMTEYLNLRKLS
jgi:hypothetical protein